MVENRCDIEHHDNHACMALHFFCFHLILQANINADEGGRSTTLRLFLSHNVHVPRRPPMREGWDRMSLLLTV